MPDPVRHDVQAAFSALAEQVREELAKPIKGVVAVPSHGVGYWSLAAIGAAVFVAAVIGLPLRDTDQTAPAPAVATGTFYETDACTRRQAAIVSAIGSYTRDHGGAPDDLEGLVPEYLTEPLVDPDSGAAYLYSHEGDTISLRCPNPEQHAPPQPLDSPQLAEKAGDR